MDSNSIEVISNKITNMVIDERAVKYHTISAYEVDDFISNNLDDILHTIKGYFPDCNVYCEEMARGKHDKKMHRYKMVRKDLRKLLEAEKLCIVVDWTANMA